MTFRTLTSDPNLQKVVRFHDLNDGRFAVETVYDAQQIVDHVHDMRMGQPAGYPSDVANYVGSIPMPMWAELKRQGIIDDPKALKQWFAIHNKLKGKDGSW